MVLRYGTLRHDSSRGLLVIKRRMVVSVGRCRVTSIDNTIQGRCLDHIDWKRWTGLYLVRWGIYTG